MLTKPRTIKVANTAHSDTTRADEIAIKTAKTGSKTGKVTAVVAVMSIFSEKICKLQSVICRNEKPSVPKGGKCRFSGKNSCRPRKLSQKTRKGWIPKKLVSNSKKLELNCTDLELNSKKTRLDCAKRPDPSISLGLKVKNKT